MSDIQNKINFVNQERKKIKYMKLNDLISLKHNLNSIMNNQYDIVLLKQVCELKKLIDDVIIEIDMYIQNNKP